MAVPPKRPAAGTLQVRSEADPAAVVRCTLAWHRVVRSRCSISDSPREGAAKIMCRLEGEYRGVAIMPSLVHATVQ